jgi:hypothetical protein
MAVIAVCIGLAGCATQAPAPCVYSFSLGIQSSSGTLTADHTLAAPGNQVTFQAVSGAEAVSGSDCPIPLVVADVSGSAVWTVSDPLDVQLSGTAPNAISGEVATCVNATADPVTVTASYTNQGVTKTGTAQLTCK